MGCLEVIPAALLSIFLAETSAAGVEHMRELLCGQIRQESAWNPSAASRSGAVGLSQMMPATYREEASQTVPSCEGIPRTNPACSIRTQIQYMRKVLRWTGGARIWATSGDATAVQLAAYNGGAGWIKRERRVCRKEPRCSTSRWWGNVEKYCLRSPGNCRENRDYPVRIFGYAGIGRP